MHGWDPDLFLSRYTTEKSGSAILTHGVYPILHFMRFFAYCSFKYSTNPCPSIDIPKKSAAKYLLRARDPDPGRDFIKRYIWRLWGTSYIHTFTANVYDFCYPYICVL